MFKICKTVNLNIAWNYTLIKFPETRMTQQAQSTCRI